MNEPVLLVEKSAGFATVTLNRPYKMNALSVELRRAIADSFSALEADPDIAVVILTGAGRAFCAGLDLEELGRGSAQIGRGESWGDPGAAMSRFSGPIIGAINGVAVTGGFELALACDILIASSAARFADTHGRVGLSPAWGLSQKLPRLIGLARAKEVSLTGNFLDAATAERWGLVNRVVEPEQLLPTSRQMAGEMLSMVPGFLSHYKRLLDTGYGMNFSDALEYEARTSLAYNSAVNASQVEARRGGVRARGKQQTAADSAD